MSDYTPTRITAREFAELPESNLPTELIHGEIIVSPTPILPHQRKVYAVAKCIEQLAGSGEVVISPMDVYLDEENILQPDVLWIRDADSRCKPGKDGYLHGAPDLVVEIFSPSTAKRDKTVKFELYEKYGVREYWMLDPIAEYIEVWGLQGSSFVKIGIFGPGETFTSPVLAGKTVEVGALFGK
jgi:Uma2 family endonuclease